MEETTIEIQLPTNLKIEIEKHPEIDWSQLFKKTAVKFLHRLALLEFVETKLDKSKFTEQDAIKLSESTKEDRLQELKSEGIIHGTGDGY